ncbi:amidase [Nocardioides ginsengisoli]|uniref:Amidase n=1 Tax=Nocardioides ginsengisoli TaxID=363868 RepID=A0ABW3W9C4_9ACTN
MPSAQTDLHWLSATALLDAYRSGALTPTAVVSSLLQRIADINPRLNAFASVNESALLDAEHSTFRIASGSARPLEGVPVAVKDLLDTDFLPTTYGSAIYRGHQPARNARVIQQLLDVGAVIIGKTSTHEFAWGVTTDNPHFGPTRNPWNLDCVPGGSSGGSAAALAAGLTPLAIGTDTAGSIRIPAALCGVTGLRPTHGSVDTDGTHPLAPSLDAVGPMARTTADLALLLRVLSPETAHRNSCRSVLRIAALPSFEPDGGEVGPTAVNRALEALATDPRFELVPPPIDVSMFDPYDLLSTVVLTEGLRTHTEAGTWPGDAPLYGADVRQRLEVADRLPPGRHLWSAPVRARLTEAMVRAFTEVDALVSPIVNVSARKVEDRCASTERDFRAGVMRDAAPQSLAGLPACSVPVGLLNGMPLGVQVTANSGRDVDALEVAAAIEARLGVLRLPTETAARP